VEKTAWDDNIAHVEGPNPARIAEQRLEIEELRENVEKLSPAQRAVISLRFGGELSVDEVAKVLGKRPGTVKALQHSGIVALKKMMMVDR
jgi:RNA polymerase sigma-70 factor (ECF subfamily)